jgi:exosortase/archaeosortase family protein
MNQKDYIIIACLVVLALFIWLRQTAWASTAADTLPILIAIPIFFWLGNPWEFRPDTQPMSIWKIVVSALCFLLGILLNITLLLSIGWTLLLWTWLSSRTYKSAHDSIQKLLILPIMAFPWVTLDADRIGWWFRLSGAWITAKVFSMAGLHVAQEGTNINVNDITISVEPACAGLNTLQSMLIAGSVVAYVILGKTNRYWWNLPLLFVMAWFTNTLRIIGISSAMLIMGTEFAMGTFHWFGGWVIILLMFIICWIIFALQETSPKIKT